MDGRRAEPQQPAAPGPLKLKLKFGAASQVRRLVLLAYHTPLQLLHRLPLWLPAGTFQRLASGFAPCTAGRKDPQRCWCSSYAPSSRLSTISKCSCSPQRSEGQGYQRTAACCPAASVWCASCKASWQGSQQACTQHTAGDCRDSHAGAASCRQACSRRWPRDTPASARQAASAAANAARQAAQHAGHA